MTHEIELTTSQQIGADKIAKFLANPNQRIFRLIGPAGSGKTTMIKYALHHLLDRDYQQRNYGMMPNVVGIALAHKAKQVLSISIQKVATFAKAYGYREKHLDNGVRIFEPVDSYKEPPLGHQPIPVFVFDEVSMTSQRMIDIMNEHTPSTSKIILMGDRAQLPPVRDENDKSPIDSDSPVFYLPLPDECHHELTEIVRQKAGNPILELATAIREEIFGGEDVNRIVNLILEQRHNGTNGYYVMSKFDAINKYIEEGDFTHNKIIAYKNTTITEHNTLVRNIVANNPTDKLINGDIIFLTNNFRSIEPEFDLYNADEYIVQNVSKSDFKIHGYIVPSYFAFIPESRFNFPVYVVTPTEEGMKVYNKALKELGEQARVTRKWGKFWGFKDSFTEFNMGFAINAYRAQGSTYKNVYVDLMDVLTCKALTPKRMLQAIYTIITRASDNVIFMKP